MPFRDREQAVEVLRLDAENCNLRTELAGPQHSLLLLLVRNRPHGKLAGGGARCSQ